MTTTLQTSSPKLGHVVICVANVAEASQFYRQAFGAMANGKAQPGYEELVLGERILALVSPALWKDYVGTAVSGESAEQRGLLLSLEVEHLPEVWVTAMKQGATELKPPHEMPWQTLSGFLTDPYGIVWELTAPIREKDTSPA